MKNEFSISPQMTKAVLIERYQELLDAYKEKLRRLQAEESARSETEKKLRSLAEQTAQEATVQGVISSLGNLRGLVGRTLNELTEEMTDQADRLEHLKKAVEVKQGELENLYDIEQAAGNFSKLISAYEKQRETIEGEYSRQVEMLQTKYQAMHEELEESYGSKKKALETEMNEKRMAWAKEKEETQNSLTEERDKIRREREREEEEYLYGLNKSRRIEEDSFAEKMGVQEKELALKREAAEKSFSERERVLKEWEGNLETMKAEIAAFPDLLKNRVAEAVEETRAVAARETKQKIEMLSMERQWEKKVFTERITGLEKLLADRETKLAELKASLDVAMAKMQQIAERVVASSSHRDQQFSQERPVQAPVPQGESGS